MGRDPLEDCQNISMSCLKLFICIFNKFYRYRNFKYRFTMYFFTNCLIWNKLLLTFIYLVLLITLLLVSSRIVDLKINLNDIKVIGNQLSLRSLDVNVAFFL